jgi:hypothetical protein
VQYMDELAREITILKPGDPRREKLPNAVKITHTIIPQIDSFALDCIKSSGITLAERLAF